MFKKKMAALLAAVMALSILSACGGTAAESEAAPAASEGASSMATSEAAAEEGASGEGRTLVVGVWGDIQEELVREFVVAPFEEETGATVELILGGSGDRFSKLYAEAENPSMDVMYLSVAQTEQATRDGMLEPVDPAVVTNYENLYDVAKAGDGYGVALTEVGIMYSTDEFAEPPTSWDVFLDPAYVGRIAPNTFPGSQGTAFISMMTRAAGGDEVEDATPGFEAIAAMKPYPLIASGIPELNQSFLDGDTVLAPQISGYVFQAQEEGLPVAYARPEEGSVAGMNCAVIPKNTENADLAKIFINYHLGQDCQAAYAERLFYGPTNSTVELDEELAAKVTYGEEVVSQLISLDNEALSAQEAEWTEMWNTMIME